MKKYICILSLIFVIALLSPSRTWVVEGVEAAQKPAYSCAQSPIRPCWSKEAHKAGWIPSDQETNEIIPRLISCESHGVSVKKLDSNNLYSYGILQYQSSTWNGWSKQSGIKGDPMSPNDAIKMAFWAIGNGLLSHWSCAYLTGILVK